MAQTAAERRSAQRRLAREIKTGTYKPSAIGEKSRQLSGERTRLINKIAAFKYDLYHLRPKFNKKRSFHTVGANPETGRRRDIEELRDLARIVDESLENDRDPLHWQHDEIFADTEFDDNSFYYH